MFNPFKRKSNENTNDISRKKEPGGNEPFLLTETDRMRADMIEPILKDSGIPYERRGVLGAGVTINAGARLETYRFYVPYGAYEKCKELLSGIL